MYGNHIYGNKKHLHSYAMKVFDWLGYKDSNLNSLLQRQVYYHYTIPQQCGADEEIRTLTRSPSLRPERSASASSATSAHIVTVVKSTR